jgi:formylglycine-generating enzyme required for sulfatase activity
VLHRERIDHHFAIAAKPVTVGQFRRYLAANPAAETEFEARGQAAAFLRRYSPEDDCPLIIVSWYQAAAYCNWLSEQDGLAKDQWCYERTVQGQMRVKPNYLSLSGYRVPTEAEWAYACRAGAITAYCYGQAVELLGKYSWYQANSGERARPVGRLKPNDLGLFDVHGNAAQWCLDLVGSGRVIRGGGWGIAPPDCRAAYRYRGAPAIRDSDLGFRPARVPSGASK